MPATAVKARFLAAHGYQGNALNLPVANLDEAIPFYETVMGFSVVARHDTPHRSVILGRDEIQIGLAENGGDPTQDGSFFAVDNVEAAFAELQANGLAQPAADYRLDQHGDTVWKVFLSSPPTAFVIVWANNKIKRNQPILPGAFMKTLRVALIICLITCAMASTPSPAQTPKSSQWFASQWFASQWFASWTASAHGPYPSGNASAQPVLDFAFPVAAEGATDQTFRLIIRPTLWGQRARLRFSNAFGTRPVTFDDAFIGLQASAGNIAAGTNARVLFNGKPSLTLAPGQVAYCDAVNLGFVKNANEVWLNGRKLAVSFHITGASGPMTWHAKALQTSYLTAPHAGSHGHEESDTSFPYTTASWFFLDALEVTAPADTLVVACFGDSITDGTLSTLNGDDRYPDVLAQRLRAAHGNRVAVINAGIGGNQITGPAEYAPARPFAGGPAALDRLERDVLSLAGVTHLILLEGINDLSQGKTADTVIAGMQQLVKRVRAKNDKIKIIGATLTPSLGYNGPAGKAETNAHRQTINQFIRTSGLFDGVADFDAVTTDPSTGALRAEFQPNSTIGGAGDKLHPNRAGYQAMANVIDLKWFSAGRKKR